MPITNTTNGTHVTNGPLTTTVVNQASPDLLINDIDSRVTRIRPMATPVDQITRLIGSRRAKSMVVEYYSIDSKPVETGLKAKSKVVEDATFDGKPILELPVVNDKIFARTDTILVPSINGYDDDGEPNGYMMLYVVKAAEGAAHMQVAVLNPDPDMTTADLAAQLTTGVRLVRMGRAAGELDVQTSQFESLPVKSTNNCQIFKAQIEQSAYVRTSAKEVGWDFSDQEEVAIMDLRMAMEKSFIFGVGMRLKDPSSQDDILFTRGIWNQAATEVDLAGEDLTEDQLISIMRSAFTGVAAGSVRKILVAGSGLIEKINRLPFSRVVTARDTVTRWGIDFHELQSKFGTLYVIHSEVFDQCDHADDGLILDPQYMTKYSHVPFKVEHLDLKRSGIRNTDALVITESSCIVLRHPKTHIRIKG